MLQLALQPLAPLGVPGVVTDEGKIVGTRTIASYFGDVRGERVWAGMALRGDWLKDLGLEVPRTIDQWETVLTAFKENYPECEAPLMIGTDLPQLDDFNLSLLTNEEIIAMNKCPNQARQLSPSLAGEKIVAWYNYIGPGEDGQNHAYYAFFNITDEDQTLTFNAKAEETADGSAPAKPLIRDLWEHKNLGDSVKLVLPPHSCKAFRV